MVRWIARLGLLVLALLVARPVTAGDSLGFAVIVNHDNAVSSLTRSHLERIFRRTVRFWPDDTHLLPVNQPFDSGVREEFTKRVLRTDVDVLGTFWNRQYFRGILPPPVLRSSEAVRAYVAETRHAVGYIPRAYVDETVKEITVVFDD